jgi:DNA-binding NarL/FixJ family response regulator
MNRHVKIIVVDDHSLFRRGLIGLLNDMPEFQVIGEAGEGSQAIKMVMELNPDIVLLDVNMPGMDGIATIEALHKNKSKAHILMLTISQQEEDLMGAIIAGADGYLLKNAEPEELRRAILAVVDGQSILSPEVTASVLRAVGRNREMQNSNPLSDRELEVLQCLSKGQTTIQIGSQLFISENTVKTHIRHILDKLEASNRTEAVSKALQMGLIQKDE